MLMRFKRNKIYVIIISFQLSVIMEDWIACHKFQRFFEACISSAPSEPALSGSKIVATKMLDGPRAD